MKGKGVDDGDSTTHLELYMLARVGSIILLKMPRSLQLGNRGADATKKSLVEEMIAPGKSPAVPFNVFLGSSQLIGMHE